MKKAVTIFLAAALVLAFSTCGGGPAKPQNGGPVQNGYYFEAGGVRLEMGAEPTQALAALGAPLGSFNAPSCALEATDTTYRYADFELTVTAPAEGSKYITGIKLSNDNVATPEGVRIGASLDDVIQAYGQDYKEDNGFYTFTRGRSSLQFSLEGAAVKQILYSYLFL